MVRAEGRASGAAFFVGGVRASVRGGALAAVELARHRGEGQQQRAAIARALANDPELVVADEPTGNLDSRTADEVLALLTALARAGKTVLVVTHERDWLSRFDRVVTLVDGRVEGVSPGGRRASGRDEPSARVAV